jgi:hypothetical protein
MKEESRSFMTAAGAKAVCMVFTLGAALLSSAGPSPRAQTREVEGGPREVKLGVRQGKKKTDLKLSVERGSLTGVTATDSAGTRSLKRIDRLAVPCAGEGKECKSVELEDGTPVSVCYCKETKTALLLPAVQKVREAAARSATGPSGGPRVRVFDGRTGAESGDAGRSAVCWADEKLRLSVCTE